MLDECKQEGISYYDLYYPVYVAKTKTTRIALSPGTTFIEDTKELGHYQPHEEENGVQMAAEELR